MMTNIIRSELMRLISSRSFIGFMLVTAMIACWPGISGAGDAAPLTERDWAFAEEAYRDDVAVWQAQQSSYEEACRAGEEWACEELRSAVEPTVQGLLRHVVSFSDLSLRVISGLGGVVLFLVAVFVSLYIGSQFTSGGITTQLTFTPQRRRLLGAKVLVGVLAAAALSLVCLGIGLAVNVLSFMWVRGVTDLAVEGGLGVHLLRYLVAAMLAGALCALLAVMFSSSWKGLLAIALVLYGGQTLLWPGGHLSFMETILPHRYIMALTQGNYPLGLTPEEFMAQIPERVLTFWDGLFYCLLVLGMLTPITMWLFQRRDMLK